jgi:THO complex subunit 3
MNKTLHSSRSTSDGREKLRRVSSDKENLKSTSFASTVTDLVRMSAKELRGHRAKVHTVGWDLDGTRLASGSVDQSVRIWSTSRMSLIRELRGHNDNIEKLLWAPHHVDLLATASFDKTVRLWDTRLEKSVHTITTPGANINLAWHPDGRTIGVGTKQDLLAFIDVKEAKLERKIQYPYEVNEFCWDRTGDLFLITTGLGHVAVMEYPSLKSVHMVQPHTANCYTIDIDPTNR